MKLLTRFFLATVTCLLLASCSATKRSGRNFLTSYSGLKQESRFNDRVTYRGDVAKLSNYDKIYLEEVSICPPEDMSKKRIKPAELDQLENSFLAALEDEIKSSRFSLASGKGENTLSFRAEVASLQPGNPALFAAGYMPYIGAATTVAAAATGSKMGAGSATMEAELIDSVTRERFFAGIDENAGNKLQIIQGLSRMGHIEAAFTEWSRDLRKWLQGSDA